jgi:PBP1b-binding outer membrane lipoprotein LpoB
MAKKKNMKWMLALGLLLMSCSKSSQPAKVENPVQPAVNPTPANPTVAVAPPATEATPKSGRGVKAEMRNVMFHLSPTAAAHLQILSGELWPTGTNEMVMFDDKTSFEVRVTNGTVSISPEALSDIMNNYVFAKKDAPLKDLSVSIDKDRLIIKGKLHNKGDIPFGTAGNLSVSSDGRLRLHTEKITALKLPVKGMMGLFGIELANVVNTSKIDGIDTDKNDLLMDLGTLLPPPHIRGKLSGVRIEKSEIVTTFGDGGRSLPPAKEKGSFMTLQGNAVRFGKLVMEQADLTVLDLDPGDTLDWDQDHYRDQLVAGYSKITPNFGLRAYAKDYSKLGRSSSTKEPKPAGN